MAKIVHLSQKQNEQLKGKSDKEIALAAARRAMEEARRNRHINEPEQLASGKSYENGDMVIAEEAIYRIHHDENYLMHVIPPVESMDKLGAEHGTFAFNAEPKKYAEVWQPLHIEFAACTGKKTKAIPDVSENFGRLFLSQKAYSVLKELLASSGEFLPVTYGEAGQGHIFNPLLTAEQLSAIDDKLTTHDQYGNLESFGFVEKKLKDTAIFKTQLDTFKGIFCNEEIKQACEAENLTGISFHPDVANPIGEAYGTEQ
mgnify:CR=1 FL=1